MRFGPNPMGRMHLPRPLGPWLPVTMSENRKSSFPKEDFDTDPSSLVALVVGRSSDGLTEVFHERGWDVRLCPGPHELRCPLLDKARCPLRERSDIAVVYVDEREQVGRERASAFVSCAAHAASPIVAVVAGDLTILDPLERTPIFTSDISPTEVADAAEAIYRSAFEDWPACL